MEEELEVTLEQGIKIINEKYVHKVIKYLETASFDSANDDYIKCYT